MPWLGTCNDTIVGAGLLFFIMHSLSSNPLLLSSDRVWFVIVVVGVSECDGTIGGLPYLSARLHEAQAFPSTIDVREASPRVHEASPRVSYTLTFGAALADGKAIKQSISIKGAGSYHQCAKCKLIIGRRLPESDGRCMRANSGLDRSGCECEAVRLRPA